MIPELPEGMTDRNVLQFYDTLSGNLSDQSTVHTNWHTHRKQPSICWICDTTTLLSKVLTLAFKINTKSPVDSMIDENQVEADSDTEIENLNIDEEGDRVPEYDLEDTEQQPDEDLA